MFNGGAERVAAQLSCIWTKLGHEVVLATALPATDKDFEYSCVAREVVDYARLNQDGMAAFCAKHKLDAVVFNDGLGRDTFQMNFAAAKAVDGLKVFVIIHHTANNWMYGTGNTRELFMSELLSRAEAVICVDKIWALWWKFRGVRAVFVPNPVAIVHNEKKGAVKLVKSIDEAVDALRGKKNLVWVGRLGDQLKRVDLAIEVFAKHFEHSVSTEGVEPTLTLLGTKTSESERVLRMKLRHLCPRSERNLFVSGFVSDVQGVFDKSDVHLFTSATEVTVPQVVLEAKSCGVETVAFDRPFLRHADQVISTEEISKRWVQLFCGERMDADYHSPEVYQDLMDELQASQQYFALHHLPELLRWRRLKLRLNPSYVLKRLVGRMK